MADLILKGATKPVNAQVVDQKKVQKADSPAPAQPAASGKSATPAKPVGGDAFVSTDGTKKTEKFDDKTGARTITYVDPKTNLPVKSTTSVPTVFDPVTKAPTAYIKTAESSYDNGVLAQSSTFDPNTGKKTSETNYKSGVIADNSTFDPNTGKKTSDSHYEGGVIAEKVEYNPETGNKKTDSHYENGTLSSTDNFDKNGKIESTDMFNPKGQKTETDTYRSDGSIFQEVDYYPETGIAHRIIVFDVKDPNRNMKPPAIQVTICNPNGSLAFTVSALSGNRGYSATSFEGSNLVTRIYDPSKGIMEIIVVDSNGKQISDTFKKLDELLPEDLVWLNLAQSALADYKNY